MTEVPVTFRYRPARPCAFVDVRGEIEHWRATRALRPAEDGWLETTLALPPGTYGYKFVLDGHEWTLDPANARTRGWDGSTNSLLVVGGADEPVLHAPARPWVFVEDDGRLCLRAGLRRGAGDRLRVRYSEGSGTHELVLQAIAEEGEHRLFETHLPVSARAVDYLFVLDDGRVIGRAGGAGQSFRVELAAQRSRAPEWWRDAILYTVFVDRFRRGGAALGALPAGVAERQALGGDLDGVIEALPWLSDLGVTALHLTPIVLSHSAHRYDAIDPRAVDPRLGGDAALDRLLEAAHRRDLKVILDIAVTHVHRDFFAFRDLRQRGPASPYFRWFKVRRFPFFDGPDPGYDHYQKGQWEEPLLDTSEPEVQDFITGTFEHWTRRGADGFRVDAAADVPLALLQRIGGAVRALNREAALFGEVIADNIHRFTASALDAATDFAVQRAMHDWLLDDGAGARRTIEVLERRRVHRGGPGWSAIGFAATHDQARILSRSRDPRVARLAHLWLLSRPEIPAIYYGDEIGLAGEAGERHFEDAWPDRCPMPWQPERWDTGTLELVRAAIVARRESSALRRGGERFFDLGVEDVVCFRRESGAEIVDVLLSRGEAEHQLELPGGAPSGAQVLVSCGQVQLDAARGTLRLGPWSGAVIRRVMPAAAAAAWHRVQSAGRQLADAAFEARSLEVPALPVHLYLTVTEGCNLRCAHCITHAPERTRAGTARRMRPWVIDALAEAFAVAEYIGFVHGGESLTSPALFDVLSAIERACSGRALRPDIHLLSNGVMLDGECLRALVESGVTSIAVSLDGGTARTNDALRIGGSFDQIVDNLAEATRTRAALGADLRLGISTVITQDNLAELPALGRLARALGVDWLKIEELFPATPLARRLLVAPRAAQVESAVAQLRAALAGSAVVLVDHRDPPSQHECRAPLQGAAAEFRAADDFANRTRFRVCRLPWHQACVDPNGDVRLVDYDHAPLGNLADSALADLWNGAAAREQRRASLRACDSIQRSPLT